MLRKGFFLLCFVKPDYLENNLGIFPNSGSIWKITQEFFPTQAVSLLTPSTPLLWLFPHTGLINKSNIYQRWQVSLCVCVCVCERERYGIGG